jgi:hypothetical protein
MPGSGVAETCSMAVFIHTTTEQSPESLLKLAAATHFPMT